MAISKKDAKKAVAILRTHVPAKKLTAMLEAVHGSSKNKSFRKSISRMIKAEDKLERPKKADKKKAA